MPRISEGNRKLLCLRRLLLEYTDDEHGLSVNEIVNMMSQMDIDVKAQTLKSDIAALTDGDLEIEMSAAGKNTKYHVVDRKFNLAELKIISDCIQSSRSLSEKKSEELVDKIGSLASCYGRSELNRQIYIEGWAKTSNEKIYYSVDTICQAINQKCAIRFYYLEWNLKKELVRRHNGRCYEASPWSLIYNDGSYYMVAYDHVDQKIKHYRVDKIEGISILKNAERDGGQCFLELDVASYSKRHFGMFGGESALVVLECQNELVNVIVDRFGCDVEIIPTDDTHFRTTVTVALSDMFYGWIIGLGDGVKIIGPVKALADMRRMGEVLLNIYGKTKS